MSLSAAKSVPSLVIDKLACQFNRRLRIVFIDERHVQIVEEVDEPSRTGRAETHAGLLLEWLFEHHLRQRDRRADDARLSLGRPTCTEGASEKEFMFRVLDSVTSVSRFRSLFFMIAVFPVPVLPTNIT